MCRLTRSTPLLLLLLLASCASLTKTRENYLHSYQQGDQKAAQKTLARTIRKEMPKQRYQESPNAVWLLLDQATMHLAQGDADGAIRNYDAAMDAIDFYRQDLLLEETGKLTLTDAISAYAGEEYEQLLAPLYFALALLQKGDEANAESLLRRTEELYQYKASQNAFAKYLFATLLEKRKGYSNALILYKQAGALSRSPAIEAAINHLESKMSGHSEPSATLLLICHNGLAPYKITEYSDASAASAAAVELFLKTTQNIKPALSSLTGLPLPKLVSRSQPAPIIATVNGIACSLTRMLDINAIAHAQLKQKMPLIAARAAARMLLRRGLVYGANEKSESLGFAADLAMLFANASTRADTRSWGTLPSSIDTLRLDLPPGEHAITLNNDTYTVQLREDELCVVQIFYIYPHVTNIIINKPLRRPS